MACFCACLLACVGSPSESACDECFFVLDDLTVLARNPIADSTAVFTTLSCQAPRLCNALMQCVLAAVTAASDAIAAGSRRKALLFDAIASAAGVEELLFNCGYGIRLRTRQLSLAGISFQFALGRTWASRTRSSAWCCCCRVCHAARCSFGDA